MDISLPVVLTACNMREICLDFSIFPIDVIFSVIATHLVTWGCGMDGGRERFREIDRQAADNHLQKLPIARGFESDSVSRVRVSRCSSSMPLRIGRLFRRRRVVVGADLCPQLSHQ
jgi:hypothetical protein